MLLTCFFCCWQWMPMRRWLVHMLLSLLGWLVVLKCCWLVVFVWSWLNLSEQNNRTELYSPNVTQVTKMGLFTIILLYMTIHGIADRLCLLCFCLIVFINYAVGWWCSCIFGYSNLVFDLLSCWLVVLITSFCLDVLFTSCVYFGFCRLF